MRIRGWLRTGANAAMLACALMFSGPALAEPDLRTARPLAGLTVCDDNELANRHYYFPGEIALGTDGTGAPDIHFLRMRYMGTEASGDADEVVYRSILSFGVLLSPAPVDALAAARQALKTTAQAVDLRPVPIRRLEAALVWQGAREESAEQQALPGGHFEADSEGGVTTAAAYWRERTYTLSLDNETSQLFYQALQAGQVVVSLGFAFVADGIGPDTLLVDLAGSPALVDAVSEQLGLDGDADSATTAARVVTAGALPIVIDAEQWPDHFQSIDINESLPPGYAALQVRCYDFNNEIRDDLAEKQVEVEAQSVTGAPVRLWAVFASDQPELYAKYLRFPVAVRLDRPYRYRLVEAGLDGRETTGEWQEVESWSRMLDVTTPAQAGLSAGDADAG